jgi:hypothetical protein
MGGAPAAAAAAAKRRQEREEEEENMSGYTAQDLAEDWEFKIIRSSTAAFRSPEKLRRILEEERRAGWIMVEKFDNSRVRLKRPAKARAGDGALGFDSYRTHVGLPQWGLAFIIVGCVLLAFLITIFFVRFVRGG